MAQGAVSRTLARSRRALAISCAFSLVISLLLMAIPLYSLQLFERVLSSASIPTLVALFFITAFLVLLQGALDLVRGQILTLSAVQLDYHLSPALVLDAIDHSAMGSAAPGSSLGHLNRVCRFLSGSLAPALLELPWTPLMLLFLAFLHPLLAVVVLLAILAMASLAWIQHRFAVVQEEGSAQNLDGLLAKSAVVLAMGMGPAISLAWRETNGERLEGYRRREGYRQGVSALFRLLRQLTQMSVLGLGIYLVLVDALSLGGVIAASMIGSRVLAPVEPIFQHWSQLGQVRSSWGKLVSLGERLDARPARVPLPRPRGEVLMDKVTFIPPGKNLPQLKQIGFRLRGGQSLAIMGPSASGKSTLLSVLLGVLRPSAGEVRVDGASLNQWTPETLGQYIGYLPQDVELLPGSVAQNIGRFGEANDALVLQAASLAGIHTLVTRLPQGYETRVGQNGYPLSSGQKQRIALARALYGNPSLLVLDEPDSNLDLNGEQALLRVLEYCREQGISVVMVSHSPKLLEAVDWLLCLKDGAVSQAGPRAKVLQQLSRPEKQEAACTSA